MKKSLLVTGLLISILSIGLNAKERVQGMEQKVYEALTQAQTHIEQKEFDLALSILRETEEKKLSTYEHAHILNMMGVVYQQNEKYEEALAFYERANNMEGLPEGFKNSLLTRLAQLNMVQGHYKKALYFAETVIERSEEPNPNSEILAAQACYYLEDFTQARHYVELALSHDRSETKPPREAWMLLANAVYFAQKDYQKMIDFQYELLKYYPRDRYIINLAAIYGELEQTEKQLALVESLFESGYLKDGNRLTNLSSLLMLHETPYKAAKVLEKAMDDEVLEKNQRNLERLGQAWQLANELDKAIPVLIQAGNLSPDGELYARVATIYISLGEWNNVVKFLTKAFSKGELQNPGSARLSLGLAHFRLSQYEKAAQAFKQAADYKKTETLALQWQKYMESEQAKMAALNEGAP